LLFSKQRITTGNGRKNYSLQRKKEILADFEIPNDENNEKPIICYDAKNPKKVKNCFAIPATIKIIDGKSKGFFLDKINQNYSNPTIKSKNFNSLIEMYKTIKTNDELEKFCIDNKTSIAEEQLKSSDKERKENFIMFFLMQHKIIVVIGKSTF
jgi:hypothetical protein